MLLPLAWGLTATLTILVQAPQAASCTEWRECREMALAAADRGEYETFHDLAWRAVQKGPHNNPALMYLLARAQSLSGRPHDALVMLGRLAEMGVASDAATNDDFRRTRQVPGWPEVEARIEQLARSNAPSVSSPPVSAPSPSSPVVSSPPVSPSLSSPAPVPRPPSSAPDPSVPGASVPTRSRVAEVVRFSTERFAVAGLAYDAVSRRVLVGDRLGGKVIVVPEGSNHAIDLVRAQSAGFGEISSLEIDDKRGDLWVTSGRATDGSATVHRVQLVSGRPLKSFRVAADLEPVRLVDLAVTPGGTVLVLDSMGPQLLALHPGGASLERAMRINLAEPASLASSEAEGIAYVAHRDGVSRIDLRARRVARVTAPRGVSLARLERIRWHSGALIALGKDRNGSRRIMRLELNASGKSVTRATTLDASIPSAAPAFVTLSGDDLIYLAGASSDASGSGQNGSGQAELVAYRVPIR